MAKLNKHQTSVDWLNKLNKHQKTWLNWIDQARVKWKVWQMAQDPD